jgi:hypothetical protein
MNLFKNNFHFKNNKFSLIVAIGGKAKERLNLSGLGASEFIWVYSVSPPFAQTNYEDAFESWKKIPAELNRRREKSR